MLQRPAEELLELHESRFARSASRDRSILPIPSFPTFPSPAPLPPARLFLCWLCETPCEGVGWLSAPALFLPSGRAPPATRLTLCARCSAAGGAGGAREGSRGGGARGGAGGAREGSRGGGGGGATRALQRCSEPFVAAVRAYKALLEARGAEVGEAPLAECPQRVRRGLLREMIALLKAALDANAVAEQTRAGAVMLEKERLSLCEELQWLLKQRAWDDEAEQGVIEASATNGTSPAMRNWTRGNSTAPQEVKKDAIQSGAVERVTTSTPLRVTASASPPVQKKSVAVGSVKKGVTRSTSTDSPAEENILLQYFEGRLKELPPFQIVQRRPNSKVSEKFTTDKGTSDRRCEEAETALRASHTRIAALEKLTDKLSETVLAHRLSATLASELDALQEFLHVATDISAAFTLQKSLLFADEMAELVRQTQRHTYRVPKQVAVQRPLHAAVKKSGEPKEVTEREELLTECAARSMSLFPESLVLKPLAEFNSI